MWDILCGIWLLGIIVLGTYTAAVNVRSWLKVRNGMRLYDEKVLTLLYGCRTKMGIRREFSRQ